MRIGEFGLASGVRVAGSAYHRHHGQPQRLAARELEQIGDQFARRLRMDLPVEQIDNELLALGDEAAPQPACPKTLRSCALTCGKAACERAVTSGSAICVLMDFAALYQCSAAFSVL